MEQQSACPEECPVAAGPLRFLIVDDDDVDRERLERMLDRTGIQSQVVSAGSAGEALRCVKAQPFDCVLLDYHLGDAVGTDLLPLLSTPDGARLPVLMVTGAGDERIAVNAIKSGAFDYIPKTQLHSDVLGRAVSHCMQRAELEAKLLAQQAHLERLSLYDGLTEIPNRNLYFDRLEQALRVAERNGERFAVLLMDLDRFKGVNDTFGHGAGDAVLKAVAERLAAALRDSDTVARLGGDEFAGILLGIDSPEGAIVAVEKIVHAVAQPLIHEGHLLDVGISIGVAFYPEHGGEANRLLAHADRAMYRAKQIGRGYQIFDPSLGREPRQALVSNELQLAIERGELYLEFQPVIHLSTFEVTGVEALVRWRSPTQGLLLPDDFIPSAERSAIIVPLTSAIIGLALDQVRDWRNMGYDLNVAVNLSARLLDDPTLPERILQALAERGLEPRLLSLELTETALLVNLDHAKAITAELCAAGIRVAVDDFGAGFTSFKYLRELDVGEIKIDRLFITDVIHSDRDGAIVRSISTLARGFGISVTAEGIEDISSYDTLRALGCDKGQGFGIAHPMPAELFPTWLETWRASHGPVQRSKLSNVI